MVKTPRILVVDDDTSLRTALDKTLRKAGYAVTLATNVDEAFTMLATTNFDLVLTDYRMPGKTGLSLARELAAKWGDEAPPLILMTAHGEMTTYLEAMELGAVEEYINKPVGREELLVILDSVLRGHGRRRRGARRS
jgi:DNA-binding response OmpR family regulator